MKDNQQSKQQDGGKPEGKSKTKAKAGRAKAGWQLPPDFPKSGRTVPRQRMAADIGTIVGVPGAAIAPSKPS